MMMGPATLGKDRQSPSITGSRNEVTTEPTDSTAEASAIDAVFVYGTLKRGQCRAGLWPSSPHSIKQAWVRGRLHDRSDYPAMTPGDDRVRGELWRFPAEAMPRVLEVLDQVEGTNQPETTDLYVRVQVKVIDAQDRSLGNAYTYLYATDPLLDGFRVIEPSGQDADVAWPASKVP